LSVLRRDDGDKNVQRDDADESGRDPFDRIDKAIHRGAIHVRSKRLPMVETSRRRQTPPSLG